MQLIEKVSEQQAMMANGVQFPHELAQKHQSQKVLQHLEANYGLEGAPMIHPIQDIFRRDY